MFKEQLPSGTGWSGYRKIIQFGQRKRERRSQSIKGASGR